MKKLFFIFVFIFLLPCSVSAGVHVGKLSHKKTAQIGETYKGIILVRNSGEEEQEVKIYQTDYLFFADGSNIYGEPGKLKRSNAKWITFSPHCLIIPPRQVGVVNYTVKVPDDKSLKGTYWSMIMVEGIDKSSPEMLKPEKGKIQIGIRTVVRYGIQMITNIGDTGSRKLNFVKTKLKKRVLQIDIENTGERALRPFVYAKLYDENGHYVGKYEGGTSGIYPGCSVRYKIDLSKIPEGKYKTLIVADCGGDHIFGANTH